MSPRGGGGTPSSLLPYFPPSLPPLLPPSIMIYMKLASINFSSTPETLCNIRHYPTQRGGGEEAEGRGGLQQKCSGRERAAGEIKRKEKNEFPTSPRRRWRRRRGGFCLKWDFVFSPLLESPSQSSPDSRNITSPLTGVRGSDSAFEVMVLVVSHHMHTCMHRGLGIYDFKASVWFVLKFALPPFSSLSPLWCNFHKKEAQNL